MERYIEGLSLHHWFRRQKGAVPVKHVVQRHRGPKESGRRSGRYRKDRKGGRVDVLQRWDESQGAKATGSRARTGEIDNNVTGDFQGQEQQK
ncbi:uncharacterized protein TRIVIDRAFT_228871 [Trichoderma virens Gv29-8]|uniref:Uncharacterized protein n=1 Tax=Hypocrea virens (strain Gv29-8 / FGSC 10586) TaxID=413071 RepID=G9NDT1_HYPVG|nr:uncharacterized protein TRIVIDRAFT_228871 [Trichoderma virens Gv29-8]EHK15181.1 hypothetical protein TRIVIDRAFT_228871 [Trichoderma virens Gv29-8]UKZ58019.1 hypothetical protein TrVGV298_011880 [Trichoderma virens]